MRCVRFDPAPAELEDVFAPTPRLSARECMAVYRNMYWYRLVDALFDVFPRLADHLGRERFTRLVCRYLATSPSRHPELERAGHALAAFIAVSEDTPEGELLADIARLEYAGLEVLLAPNGPRPLSLAEVDPTRLPSQSLTLSPALAAVDVRDDAIAVLEGRAAERVETAARSLVLLWRRRFAVRHRVLASDEAGAFAAALAGRSVEEICSAFASPERASHVLRTWFDEALVIAVSEPS